MKQHITQEQATNISAKFAEDESYETNICNAAVQHYVDQQAKELPGLPAPQWLGDIRGYTLSQLKDYGAACAAHAQDVTELVEALEAAQRWHNGDKWRDTDKHEEWQIQADSLTAALSKYKGAK